MCVSPHDFCLWEVICSSTLVVIFNVSRCYDVGWPTSSLTDTRIQFTNTSTLCKIRWQSKPRCCIKLFTIVNPTFIVYIIILCPENVSNDTVTGPNWNLGADKKNTYRTPVRIPVFEWVLYQEHTFTDKRQNTRKWRQILLLVSNYSCSDGANLSFRAECLAQGISKGSLTETWLNVRAFWS